MKHLQGCLGIFCLLISASLFAADATKPVIESIEGDQIVVVKTTGGKSKPASKGLEVDYGDRVKTSDGASAKIRYPDGSKLLVGRGSEVEVQENKNGSQYNKVYSGYVRGLIRKAGQPDKSAPPRFIIRSRTVVMGVRGTDFVMSQHETLAKGKKAAGSEVQIHTLDGVVEVAKDESTLMEGKGRSVARDQMITANEMKLEAPRFFDRDVLAKSMKEVQPDFEALAQKDPEAVKAAHENTAPAQLEPDAPKLKQEEKEKREEQSRKEAEEAKIPQKPRWQGALFQLSPLFMTQETGGEFFSFQTSWSPRFRLWWIFGVRGVLGFYPMKSRTREDSFGVLEVDFHAVVALFWDTILLEPGVSFKRMGGGKEGPNKTAPIIQASFRLSENGWLERVFVAYTHYDGFQDLSGTPTADGSNRAQIHIFKAGVGLKF